MESKSTKDEQFDSIYRAYKDSIYKVAMHYTKNEDLSEEITQQAFFQLYTHFENVDFEWIEPWLITTARNLFLNYFRESKRMIFGDLYEVLMETKDKFYMEDVGNSCLKSEGKRLVVGLNDRIFEHLYKKHKNWYDAITLVYGLGKSQKEAAEELGITVEVLNSRIYRAKQWIRKNYAKEYEEVVEWL